MGQNVEVTGMVLNVMPIGENDKRITLLTKERGKITAFARGARRPNSPLLAATSPFSFGQFEVYEGRSSYMVIKVSISNYFRELATDYLAAYYGFYFLEVADYCCQENNDEREMLKLVYQSLRALESAAFDNRLVRVVFELKALAVNGEGPNVFSCIRCRRNDELTFFSVKRGGMLCKDCGRGAQKESGKGEIPGNIDLFETGDSVLYTMQYIISAAIEKLYTFSVSPPVLFMLQQIVKEYRARYLPHKFQSLGVLEEMTSDFNG